MWDLHSQTGNQVMANQKDVVVNKLWQQEVVIHVGIPSNGNTTKMENKKNMKYQGLKEEIEKLWKVKTSMVWVVLVVLWAVTFELLEWFQEISRTT